LVSTSASLSPHNFAFLPGSAHEALRILELGLSVILVFVGVKAIISDLVGEVPIWVSLPFIAAVVAVSILASLWRTRG